MATLEGEKTGGRKKGTPNKLTKNLIEVLTQHNYDPILTIIEAINLQAPTIEEVKKYKSDLIQSGVSETDAKPLVRKFSNNFLTMKEKLDVSLRLLEYIYPKRKAIEIKPEEDNEKPVFSINFQNPKKVGE